MRSRFSSVPEFRVAKSPPLGLDMFNTRQPGHECALTEQFKDHRNP